MDATIVIEFDQVEKKTVRRWARWVRGRAEEPREAKPCPLRVLGTLGRSSDLHPLSWLRFFVEAKFRAF